MHASLGGNSSSAHPQLTTLMRYLHCGLKLPLMLCRDSVWMERPMSQDAIAYATGDVVHLLDIAKHLNSLDSRLALALSQFQASLMQRNCEVWQN